MPIPVTPDTAGTAAPAAPRAWVKRASWSADDASRRQALRRHFMVASVLQAPGDINPADSHGSGVRLVADAQGLTLTLPWHEGIDLDQWLARRDQRATESQVCRMALAIAAVLSHLARLGLTHAALSLDHVLWNEGTGQARLLSLGVSRFARATDDGLQDLPVTHATDLQCLGRIVEALLHGREAGGRDLAPALTTGRAHRSLAMRRFVEQLRAAGRAGGFQHADAVAAAAQRLLDERLSGTPGSTDLGAPPDLIWPGARFGRNQAFASLMQAYAMTAEQDLHDRGPATRARHSTLALVNGPAGVGKTAVLQAALASMVQMGASAGSGKFSPAGSCHGHGHGRPLAALCEALDAVLSKLVHTPGRRRTAMAARLSGALGEHAQVVADAVPRLTTLLGPLPPVAAVSADASRIRFDLLMRQFVAALCSAQHPLVLMLDDLQWADQASLDMVRGLLRDPNISHLLILGAYRSEEADLPHPLRAVLSRLVQDGIGVTDADVAGWSQADIEAALVAAGVSVSPLTMPIHHTQHGAMAASPLGVNLALREAFDAGCMHFDAGTAGWVADGDELTRLMLDREGAVALAERQLRRLPAGSLDAVITGALLGVRFSLSLLSRVLAVSLDEALQRVWPALAAGLLRSHESAGDARQEAEPYLSLAHDAIQQAALGLISDTERQRRHPAIAEALMADRLPQALPTDTLFDVARHLGRTAADGAGPQDWQQAAEVNLLAGRHARATGDMARARKHFDTGVALLPPEGWQQAHALAFELTASAAEAAYLDRDFDVQDRSLTLLDARSSGVIETARAMELRVQGLLARQHLREALELGEQALLILGVTVLPASSPQAWARPLSVTELQNARSATESVFSTTATHVDMAFRVLVRLTPCAYITSFDAYARVILTMHDLALRHPESPFGAFAYANYGLILCGVGRNAEAFDAGALALSLNRSVLDPTLRSKVATLVHGFLQHWQRPVAEALSPMLAAVRDCSRCGDREYLGYAAFLYCDKAWSVTALGALERTHQAHTVLVGQFGHDFSWRHCQVWLQAVRALRGSGGQALQLSGADFDQDRDLPALLASNNQVALFTAHVLRGWLAWHRGDRVDALHCCEAADTLAVTAVATLLSVEHRLLWCLCLLTQADPMTDPAARTRIDALLAQLRTWADNIPHNVLHKLHLVSALHLQAAGDRDGAARMFERAREAAARTPFLQDQAVTAELFAEFELASGRRRAAREQLHAAAQSLHAWGASAALDALLERHAWLQDEPSDTVEDDAGLDIGVARRMSRLMDELALDRVRLALDDVPQVLVCERLGGDEFDLTQAPASDALKHLDSGLLARAREQRRYLYCGGTGPPVDGHHIRLQGVWPVQVNGSVRGLLLMEARGRRLLSPAYVSPRLRPHVQALVDEVRIEQLAHQLQTSAQMDPDTGLPNRSSFIRNVDLALARSRGSGDATLVVALITMRDQPSLATPDADRGQAIEWPLRLRARAWSAGLLARVSEDTCGVLYWGVKADTVLRECESIVRDLQPRAGTGRGALAVLLSDDGQMTGATALRDGQLALTAAAGTAAGTVFWFDAARHRGPHEALQQVEEKLQQQTGLRVEAEQRNQEKTRFIAAAAHDMKQPLHAMSMVLEPAYRALCSGDTVAAMPMIQVLRKLVYQLREQFTSVLEISRLDCGLVEPDLNNFDLIPLLEEAIALTEPYADSLGVAVSLTSDLAAHSEVTSDLQLMLRVVMNLVNNAIKYRRIDGDRPAEVALHVFERGDRAVLRVKDNGIGIRQALIDEGAIFRPFFQAPLPEATTDRGVGLGLAIVKASLDMLPGHGLQVRSQLGKGSEFDVVLPIARAEGRSHKPPSARPSPVQGGGNELVNVLVLLFDDEEVSLQRQRSLLQRSGAFTVEARNHTELRHHCDTLERTPDVLLLAGTGIDGETARDAMALVADSFGPLPTLVLVPDAAKALALAQTADWQVLAEPVQPEDLIRQVALAGQRANAYLRAAAPADRPPGSA